MNTQITNEYRDLPLSFLTESKTNPRRTFEEDSLKELAESIRTQGVLSPLLGQTGVSAKDKASKAPQAAPKRLSKAKKAS